MYIEQQDKSPADRLSDLLDTVTDNVYVSTPCKVTAIHGNYVDVLPIINDDEDNQELYDVPIQRTETQSAYIFLGVKVGDRGTLVYTDRSISAYKENGSEEYDEDDRSHDGNDAVFNLGFIPDNEAFVYPENVEIEIGLKNQTAKISFTPEGNINIIAQDANIQANNVNVTATNINSSGTLTHIGNATINGDLTASGTCTFSGKEFLGHTHSNGNQGSPTGGVI